MASVSDVFGSTGLKAEDLKGQDVNVEIAGTRICKFDDGDKIEVKFVGKEKSLVCNITNARMISRVVGSEDLDEWTGHPITLYSTYVDFRGDSVLAIRVRGPQQTMPLGAMGKPDANEPPPHVDDSDIPF